MKAESKAAMSKPIKPAGNKLSIAEKARSFFTTLGSRWGKAACNEAMSGKTIKLASAIRIHGQGRRA